MNVGWKIICCHPVPRLYCVHSFYGMRTPLPCDDGHRGIAWPYLRWLLPACQIFAHQKKYSWRLAVFFAKIPPSSYNQELIIVIVPLSLYTILQRWSPLRNKNAWDARSLVNLAPLSFDVAAGQRERGKGRKEGRQRLIEMFVWWLRGADLKAAGISRPPLLKWVIII